MYKQIEAYLWNSLRWGVSQEFCWKPECTLCHQLQLCLSEALILILIMFHNHCDSDSLTEYVCVQEVLQHQDFSKFQLLKPRLLEVVDKMLAEDIARLMAQIPHEEVVSTSEPLIKGNILPPLPLHSFNNCFLFNRQCNRWVLSDRKSERMSGKLMGFFNVFIHENLRLLRYLVIWITNCCLNKSFYY